ncbi:MAG: hypothetical protein JWO32_1416 [Bacteroidetes bacterium]|nr:hypothetical protein [Bacteroidota bacterium]
MNVLLSTAYWPNLHYFYYVLKAEKVTIEAHEHYQKQSFRNRTQVLTANGILDLTIPVKKKALKELISEQEISYSEAWQLKHWRAITSAYKNSPYFEYFEDDLKKFYTEEYKFLLNYNLEQLKTLFKLLRIKKELHLTSHFERTVKEESDLREIIHPKNNALTDDITGEFLSKPYYQTFENKFKFTPNLSVLDLLLNKGMETLDYFPKATLTL